MKEDKARGLHDQLRSLRLREAYPEARQLIREQANFEDSLALSKLLYEHEDFWWAPLVGRRAILKRRCAADAEFVRACWKDAEFMAKFNRFARPLPPDDEQLRQLLSRERAGLLSELKALHWTIHTPSGPVGFVSATEHSSAHRHCEFLIGLRQPASPVPVEAARLAIQFLRDRVRVERLTAYFYADNTYAARVATKFGFQPEGLLKSYLRNKNGSRIDVAVSGLVLTNEHQNSEPHP